jgi:DNA (cytosine-5)-methyltransferase 1
MLTHIDLFAGIGGFSCGFQKAGFKTVAYVEKDKAAQAVLRHHHPNALILGDVKDAGKHNLPYADVITFGSPCQDLSVAGKRKGLDGERSNLFFEAIRIVSELKPSFAVWENVPGALTSNSGRDFANVLAAFQKCWARDIAWGTLDAQYFGVAQRRKRLFVVADFRGARAAEVLFERDGSYGNPPPSREAGQGTTPYVIKGAAIGRRPENGPQYGEVTEDGTCYTLNTSEVHAIAGTLAASGAGSARPAGQKNETSFLIPVVASTVSRGEGQGKERGDGCDNLIVATVFQQNQREEIRDLGDVAGALASEPGMHQQNFIAFSAGQGVKAGGIAASEYTAPTLKGVGSGTNQVPTIAYGLRTDITPKWLEECSPTLLTPSPTGGGHPPEVANGYGVRRLTPTECERLQGFPDGHTAVNEQSDSARYKQLGNAVCVNVAEWLGRRIAQVDTA